MEDDVAPADEGGERRFVLEVSGDEARAEGAQPLGARRGADERRDRRAPRDERLGEMAADEAGAAGEGRPQAPPPARSAFSYTR